jgi:hypothetical protein
MKYSQKQDQKHSPNMAEIVISEHRKQADEALTLGYSAICRQVSRATHPPRKDVAIHEARVHHRGSRRTRSPMDFSLSLH